MGRSADDEQVSCFHLGSIHLGRTQHLDVARDRLADGLGDEPRVAVDRIIDNQRFHCIAPMS